MNDESGKIGEERAEKEICKVHQNSPSFQNLGVKFKGLELQNGYKK